MEETQLLMDRLSTLPIDLFIPVCEYLSDSELLRLQEVSSGLRHTIIRSSRVQAIHSKKLFFVSVDDLDHLVEFSKSPPAQQLKHLVLDVSSPYFFLDIEDYKHKEKNGEGWRLPNASLPSNQYYYDKNFKPVHWKRGPETNVDHMQRLEEAFRNLSNLTTLEFAQSWANVDRDGIGFEKGQKLLRIWEKYNPALQEITDWRTKFGASNLKHIIDLFQPVFTECNLETIYVDTLFSAAKTQTKFSQIILRDGIRSSYDEHNIWGTELSQFHGSNTNPQEWAQRYRDAFADLKVLHLSVKWDYEQPDESLLFFPTAKNVEELYLTQHKMYCAKPHAWMFPLPKYTHLPRLRRLKIQLGEAKFEEISAFLLNHKASLRELTIDDSEPDHYRIHSGLVSFLKDIYTNLSLTAFDLMLRLYKRSATITESQNIRLVAVGNWKDNTPFVIIKWSPWDSSLITGPNLAWNSFIKNIEEIELWLEGE
ncbi:hypothetical protein ABW20_dc0106754 [Dactylellina cionopaga]|nr:hypothetical protein ABW20_dc0106754 [Dactylellina cionopaga]